MAKSRHFDFEPFNHFYNKKKKEVNFADNKNKYID